VNAQRAKPGARALRRALGPLIALLDDPQVVEVMLNADGVVWIEKLGEGVLRTPARMSAADAERMLRLVASEVLVELNPQQPSLSAKLPAPWGARLQAATPPIVDAPVFALRQPARVVFSLGDYVSMRLEVLAVEAKCRALDEVCRALLLTIEQARELLDPPPAVGVSP
jgi:type IV secretion system protein VirB11